MIIRNLVLAPRTLKRSAAEGKAKGNELIAHGIAMGNWILP